MGESPANRRIIPPMSESTPLAESQTNTLSAPPTRWELFRAFLKIGVSAFGGALPWVHRIIVEEKRWLHERDFNEILTVCQAVPGPNVVNTSVFIGTRFRGITGALAAFAGLIGGPLAMLLVLNELYQHFSHIAQVKSALKGMSVVATAYFVAMALKMAKPFRKNTLAVLLCIAAACLSVFLHWHMAYVLLACGTVGVALSKAGKL